MLKTYFFIPANNQRFIEKSLNGIEADYFIFDLEDSISEKEVSKAVMNLNEISILNNHFVRCNLFVENTTIVNYDLIFDLIEIGFQNFVIPKFFDSSQIELLKEFFEQVESYSYRNFSFVLLVEHPAGILNLGSVLSSKLLNITAIGLGNYDYCNIMGMKHTLENLLFARQTILTYAKAYDIEAVDIVSLDLNDDEKYCNEVKNGFSMGFDGKFLIHPKQLSLIDKVQFYTEEEVEEAIKVFDKIKLIQNNKIAVVKVNGRIYEKPHINRILKIINWSKKYGSK